MIKLKNNCAELDFNFHRRFLRDAIPDDQHAKHYLNNLIKDDPQQFAEWENRPFIYSSSWIKEVNAVGTNMEQVSTYYSKPLSKTSQFGDFYKTGVEQGIMPFPFGFINFDLFNGFKNANNVSGRIVLSFAGDHFLLEGEFVTLPPARLESFNPTRKIYSNEDIKKVVAEFSEIFRQAADLKE